MIGQSRRITAASTLVYHRRYTLIEHPTNLYEVLKTLCKSGRFIYLAVFLRSRMRSAVRNAFSLRFFCGQRECIAPISGPKTHPSNRKLFEREVKSYLKGCGYESYESQADSS